jgi:hypothetical protein
MEVDFRARQIATAAQQAIANSFLGYSQWSETDIRSNLRYTREIKAALKATGIDLGFDVRMSERQHDRPANWQFVFDVCWLDTGPERKWHNGFFRSDNRLRRVLLAAEIEWMQKLDEINYDFSKLLIARASVRLFIFFSPRTETANRILNSLIEAVQAFDGGRKTDIYLIGALIGEARQFTFNLIDGTGRISH